LFAHSPFLLLLFFFLLLLLFGWCAVESRRPSLI
jgi:hypothetical protein